MADGRKKGPSASRLRRIEKRAHDPNVKKRRTDFALQGGTGRDLSLEEHIAAASRVHRSKPGSTGKRSHAKDSQHVGNSVGKRAAQKRNKDRHQQHVPMYDPTQAFAFCPPQAFPQFAQLPLPPRFNGCPPPPPPPFYLPRGPSSDFIHISEVHRVVGSLLCPPPHPYYP